MSQRALPRLLAPNGWRRLPQDRPLVPLVLLLLLLTGAVDIVSPGSVTPDWVSATLIVTVPLGIIAAAQTLVILTAGIDLSVGVVGTTACYVTASLSSHGTAEALVIGLGIALLIGVISGIGIGVFQVQPIIMTLGMGLVATGVLNVYAEQITTAGVVPVVPAFVRTVGAGHLLGGIPNIVILWIVLGAVIIGVLGRTGYGRLVYAIGDNRTACRLAGVKVWQVLLVTYALSGFLAGLGGVMLSGATNVADRGLVEPFLLPSVAAVVIGGTSVFGGSGGYAGTMLGAVILTVLSGLLVVLHASSAIEQIVNGGIILVVVAIYVRMIRERS
jgi:ribose transport system permease protein